MPNIVYKFRLIIYFMAIFFAVSNFSAKAGEFHLNVAAGEEAMDSLREALAKARAHRAEAPADTIIIDLPRGVVRMKSALRIGPSDSGRIAAPLVIRGDRGGRTSLSGAALVSARKRRDDENAVGPSPALVASKEDLHAVRPLAVVPRGAYANVVASRIELFQGSQRLRYARWPKQGYSTDARIVRTHLESGFEINAPQTRLNKWRQEKSLWLGGYFAYDWAFETLPAKIEWDSDVLRLMLPNTTAPFPLRKSGLRYFVFNSLSDLSEPGEFVLDEESQTVLLIPFPSDDPIESAVADNLVTIEGADHVIIENLAMEKTLGAVVQVNDSRDIVVRDCFVGLSGGDGLQITGGSHFLLERCVVADTSEKGVQIFGGDRRSLTRADHAIRDSIIVDFGRDSRTYRPGVAISGVGVSVEGSVIAYGPHAAVMIAGNDNTITGNEIYSVVKETDDASAIYMGRDWTQRGNVIAKNLFHDIGALDSQSKFVAFGVYLDDQYCGVTIENNVFSKVKHPVFIGGGRDNKVIGNAFLLPDPAGVLIDARGLERRRADKDPDSELMKRFHAVDVTSDLWRSRYPELADILEDEPGAPKGNVLADNDVYGGQLVTYLDASAQPYTHVSGPTQAPGARASIDHEPSTSLLAAGTDVEASSALAQRLASKPNMRHLRFFSRAMLEQR